MIAAIEIPDGSVTSLAELAITLPRNWGMRPAAPNAQRIGGEVLAAVDRAAATGQRICGVRVPSVISTSDCNVLLDPRQRAHYKTVAWSRIPFDWLLTSST